MNISDAKTALSYGKYIALDTESTGFQPNKNYSLLLEIGAVKYENGVIVDRFDELVNPGIKIPKKIVELTGISNEMVKGKDSYIEVLTRFRKWCDTDKYIFIMHNATHDLRFLEYFGEKCGVSFNEPYIDTYPLAKDILGNGYWYKINSRINENYKLSTLALFYGIKDENHHRAINDAEVTMQVFQKLKQTAFKKEPSLYIKQYWQYPLKKEIPLEKNKIKIISVCPWDKKKRIYVNLSQIKNNEELYSTIFYDFEYSCWGIKQTGFPVASFKEIENVIKKEYQTGRMIYENFYEKKYFSSCFVEV